MLGRANRYRTALPVMGVVLLSSATAIFSENIDPANDGSQYAWAENLGWINAEPSGNGGPGVQVSDFDLTGWLWAENAGWISLSCKNTSSCDAVPYGVLNTCAGTLSGFAWAENLGWIDLAPALAGITIDPLTGEFHGRAWSENGGFVGFNCADTASCGVVTYKVATSWSPSVVVPAGSPTLTLQPSGGSTRLSWTDLPGAAGYDVLKGDLLLLQSSGGDFTVATQECLTENRIFTSQTFAPVPVEGNGFWFLVRGVNCAGGGTYDTGAPSQVGARDAEIAASGNDCIP